MFDGAEKSIGNGLIDQAGGVGARVGRGNSSGRGDLDGELPDRSSGRGVAVDVADAVAAITELMDGREFGLGLARGNRNTPNYVKVVKPPCEALAPR